MKYTKSLENLIEAFKLLPGIREKNAERMAFSVLKFDDDNIRSFWMKNCEFPIVVVFCDKNWKIVSIHRMKVEETCNDEELTRYSSVIPARYAIEFKDSNWFDAVPDIAVGTQVEVKL